MVRTGKVPGGSRRGLSLWVTVLLVGVGTLLHATADPAESARHLQLLATEPAADTVLVAPPSEIRLWFSQPPQARGLSIRLVDSRGELVDASEAAPDEADAKQVFSRPRQPLAPGAYTAHWRVLARDGHAQRGSFAFRVAPDD